MKTLLLASVMAGIVAGAGCARFGYSSRVLHRVSYPDGRFLAVCQEVPVFDGVLSKNRIDASAERLF